MAPEKRKQPLGPAKPPNVRLKKHGQQQRPEQANPPNARTHRQPDSHMPNCRTPKRKEGDPPHLGARAQLRKWKQEPQDDKPGHRSRSRAMKVREALELGRSRVSPTPDPTPAPSAARDIIQDLFPVQAAAFIHGRLTRVLEAQDEQRPVDNNNSQPSGRESRPTPTQHPSTPSRQADNRSQPETRSPPRDSRETRPARRRTPAADPAVSAEANHALARVASMSGAATQDRWGRATMEIARANRALFIPGSNKSRPTGWAVAGDMNPPGTYNAFESQ